jgi:hypothetical protein
VAPALVGAIKVRKGSRRLARRLAGALAAAAFAAGCGAAGESHSSQAAPSPVVLADTSPGQLQIGVFISLGGYEQSNRNTAMVDINFTSGGRQVRFVRSETVSCNGIALTRYVGAFEGRYQIDAIAAKTMTCAYFWDAGSTSITVQVPRKLVIFTPSAAEAVVRSTHTDVNYDADPSAAPWAVVAISAEAKASALPSATSSSHASIDTSHLTPGPGSIAITQQLDLDGIQAPAFQAVTGRANLMTMIQVVWQ